MELGLTWASSLTYALFRPFSSFSHSPDHNDSSATSHHHHANPPPAHDTPIVGDQKITAQNERCVEDILNPPYAMNNGAGPLSSRTSWVRPFLFALYLDRSI